MFFFSPKSKVLTMILAGMLRLELHKVGENVDGNREDDGAVVLGGDTIQSLQVSQLGTGRLNLVI